MNDMNFDSLLNLTTPQSFIDKALSIEAKEQKPKVLFSAYFNRTLGAVACLVLICILSVTLFSLTHNNSTLTAQPQGPTTRVDNTESTDSKNEYNNDNRNDGPALIPDVFEQVEETKPTQSNDNKKPTQKPQNSTQAQNPTDAPPDTPEDPSNPHGHPNSSGKPSEIEPPNPNGSVIPPENETQPVEILPTEPGDPFKPVEIITTIYITVPSGSIKDSENIYCMLYDSNEAIVGNSYIYSAQRKCTVSLIGSTALISYSPISKGIYYESGTYIYKFYTSSGKIMASGSIYLTNPYE